MTQDDRWLSKFTEVKDFVEKNQRNPSKHNPEERGQYGNWLRHNRKLYNGGELKEPRLSMFKELIELTERYKHVNQYM